VELSAYSFDDPFPSPSFDQPLEIESQRETVAEHKRGSHQRSPTGHIIYEDVAPSKNEKKLLTKSINGS
jgi:hypothetical protein